MHFKNLIKGQVTQSLLTTLLERAGYRVTRFGIEELFREVKYLDLQQYRRLNLSLHLRTLPDLLVAELDLSEAYLVEVKFRKAFTDQSARSLHSELTNQRKYWPDSYAVVMIANSFVRDGRFHQDYIRVVEPDNTDWLIEDRWSLEQRWDGLPHIQQVFKKFFQSLDNQQNADLITTTLKELSKL
jgi:hypothetical protein